MVRHGTSGRVTSVTVGKMPNRQVIVYDKRKEAIAGHKVHWWEIWNACLAQRGEPPLDPKDREGSQVWRVELRAGKSHLKKRWDGKTWADLDDKLGSLLLKTLDEVRYVIPDSNTNRSRWSVHPIWDLVREEIDGDLVEMMCPLDPHAVREVLRRDYIDLIGKQLTGLSATYAIALGLSPSDAHKVPEVVRSGLSKAIAEQPDRFVDRMARAGERIVFLEPGAEGEGRAKDGPAT